MYEVMIIQNESFIVCVPGASELYKICAHINHQSDIKKYIQKQRE